MHIYIYMYVCMYVYIYIYVCMYVRMYVCMYVCVYNIYMGISTRSALNFSGARSSRPQSSPGLAFDSPRFCFWYPLGFSTVSPP